MKNAIKWGIIGLGKIAEKFASDLLLSEKAMLHAVASRSLEKAKQFSAKHNAQNYYDSYEQLAQDSEVDIIYIATPHSFHFENTMMCLKHNKNVLCEKPIGIDMQQSQKMFDEAKSKNLFLMEGLWTRFIPATQKFIELLNQEVIGDLLFIRADFGFKADFDPESRVYKKELGAGSLLDIGIYPVYLSLLTLGIPKDIKVAARFTSTEVDSYCSMLFDYNNLAKASLESTIEADTPIEAYIYGTKGHIKLHSRFHHTEKITVFINGQLKEEFEIPYTGNGYLHEIEEVNNCLLNGYKESSKLTHQTSMDLITILDRVRKEIGIEYKLTFYLLSDKIDL